METYRLRGRANDCNEHPAPANEECGPRKASGQCPPITVSAWSHYCSRARCSDDTAQSGSRGLRATPRVRQPHRKCRAAACGVSGRYVHPGASASARAFATTIQVLPEAAMPVERAEFHAPHPTSLVASN